ncbi:MAG TPA: sugar ABC transporter permease [Acidimicrobiales bacterium]|nr:sugar ABC transporter permease [Acidimicrobiales bacterium]
MWGGIAVGAAFYILFGIAPAVATVLVSFTNYSGLPGSPTSFAGLSNYTALFTTEGPGFISSIIDTLFFVVGVTVVQNVVAMLLAHRLQGEGKTATLLRVLAFFPIVLGVTVVGIVWLLLFDPLSSPAQAVFGAFGVRSAFFGSSIVAMPLVIIVQVWQNLGFTMVVFIGSLKMIPRSIYEAAGLDGVTPWKRFTSITWPMMAPAVTVNVLFAVIGSLTTYNLIYILTDGDFGTNTLGMLAFNSAFGATADLGLGAAVTVALLVVAICVAVPLALLLRYRERRLLT